MSFELIRKRIVIRVLLGKESLQVRDITNNETILQIIFNKGIIIFKKTRIFGLPKVFRNMIQRIQSVYLLVVALLAGIGPWVANLWIDAEGVEVFAKDELWVMIAFLASAAMALVTIFRYKHRQHQFVMNRLTMILQLFLLGFFVYRSLNLSGETLVSEKGIGMLIPVFSIVFLVLANRAIKKDEDLVKSVDRLR